MQDIKLRDKIQAHGTSIIGGVLKAYDKLSLQDWFV